MNADSQARKIDCSRPACRLCCWRAGGGFTATEHQPTACAGQDTGSARRCAWHSPLCQRGADPVRRQAMAVCCHAAGLWPRQTGEPVVDWRWQQEQAMPEATYLRSRAAVEHVSRPFEPLIKYLHRSSARWADLTSTSTKTTNSSAMPAMTFLWHDYETFGTRPAFDRPVQFAAIRTDEILSLWASRLRFFARATDAPAASDGLPGHRHHPATGAPRMASSKPVCHPHL